MRDLADSTPSHVHTHGLPLRQIQEAEGAYNLGMGKHKILKKLTNNKLKASLAHFEKQIWEDCDALSDNISNAVGGLIPLVGDHFRR